jgi:hypothetical protein
MAGAMAGGNEQRPDRVRSRPQPAYLLDHAPAAHAPTARLPLGTEPSQQPSRRVHERQRMNKTVTVTEMDVLERPGATWQCRATDLSRGGMGLASKRMAYPGRGLLIVVRDVPGEGPRLLYGVVRQSRYIPGEGYVLGVQFEQVLDTPDVRLWRTLQGLNPER